MTAAETELPGSREAVDSSAPIVFFDGVCGFCNAWVDFLLTRDRRGRLRFAPLQGETARRMLAPEDVVQLHSLVLWTSDRVFRKSSAVAQILLRLGGARAVAGSLLWLVPRPVRDWGYDFIAKRRYNFFGKRETCRMPTLEERGRFLP